MTMASDTDAVAQEQVTFIPHHLPGLEAGEYQLTVSQHIEDGAGNRITGDTLASTYSFAVRSDRFSLKKPGETVYSVFPADNATGEYSAVLPHVVFTRRTFPWSRTLTEHPPPTVDAKADVPTWLAVLLLDQDDPAIAPTAAKIGDLFPPKLCATSTLGPHYSYFWNATDASGLEPGEQLSDPVRILDLPLDFFWRIAPTSEDLKLLAHARKVSLLPKATATGVAGQGEPVGDFAVVFGSRLPQTGRKTQAVLVSLEGLGPFLPTDSNGGPPAGTSFSGSLNIRLAVLQSWTFFSTGEAARFTDRLLALDGAAPVSGQVAQAGLRLPYTGNDLTVRKALSAGYAPLEHSLRTGGRTVSWYRGPLTPYQIAKSGLSFPITSPDKATAFDPTTGLFDVSYAAAWTLGRMLGLQDRAFAAALYRWKKGLARKAVAGAEDKVVQQRFAALLRADAKRPRAASSGAAQPHVLLRSLLNILAEPPR
jgi:hypothetical protein